LGRVGIGVLSHQVRPGLVDEVLAVTGRAERRFQALPARLGVYFVLALCLFSGCGYGSVMRAMVSVGDAGRLAGLGWCFPSSVALAKLRRRLGAAPFEVLLRRLSGMVPVRERPWSHAFGLLVCAWDGTEWDVADTPANLEAFGGKRGRRGECGFPKVRLLVLMACGSRQIIDACVGGRGQGENTLARRLVRSLGPGMLLLADRGFPGFGLWTAVTGRGCQALWRVSNAFHLPAHQVLPDGSYLSRINDPADARRWRHNVAKNKKLGHRPPKPRPIQGVTVRVIESVITVTTADGTTRTQKYRLITTLLDWRHAPAAQLAALYGRRWACETGIGEIKTRLRGPGRVLRAQDPECARQEVWAYLIIYQAIRLMISHAALADDLEPARVSFTAARDIARRMITTTPRQATQTTRMLGPDLCRQLITTHTTSRLCPRAVKRPRSPFPRKKTQPTSQNAHYKITITRHHQPPTTQTDTPRPHHPAQPRAA
jgi:hypothetical protein